MACPASERGLVSHAGGCVPGIESGPSGMARLSAAWRIGHAWTGHHPGKDLSAWLRQTQNSLPSGSRSVTQPDPSAARWSS
jgi:hypothetical protein